MKREADELHPDLNVTEELPFNGYGRQEGRAEFLFALAKGVWFPGEFSFQWNKSDREADMVVGEMIL